MGSQYTLAFRSLVVPKLRQEIDRQAALIANDMAEYNESRAEISALATRLGMSRLSPSDYDSLAEWIDTTLLTEIDRGDRKLAEIDTAIQCQKRADPVAYYTALAKDCGDDDAIRWTFAAINKQYRDHLKGDMKNKRASVTVDARVAGGP